MFQFLQSIGVEVNEEVIHKLEEKQVDTDALKGLKADDLKELGFEQGECLKILQAIQPSQVASCWYS